MKKTAAAALATSTLTSAALLLILGAASAQPALPPVPLPDAGGADTLGTSAAPPDGGAPDAGTAPDAQAADARPDGAPETSLPAAPVPPVERITTGIRGRILDRRTGAGLVAAPVIVKGDSAMATAVTGPEGNYEVAVDPGTYTVRSYYDMYHGARIDRIRVADGKLTSVTLVLDPIDEVQEVAVEELEIPYRADTTTAAAQDQLRQASSGIGEGFGAKQMSQVGASDASSAAARVVGVSIDSSQLVIRGLGGRYNRVLLNGVPVPSVDPDVPGVDLDLFPTSVIDSLTVNKTFLPDMPADFAGGVMEIRSVSFPRKFTLEFDLSGAWSSQSTFQNRLDHRGGRYDVVGFDDGRRGIPDTVASRQRPGFLTEAEAETFRNVWQYRHRAALPKLGTDVTVGDSFMLGKSQRFGYLLTAGYERDLLRKVGRSRPNNNLDADGNLLGDEPTNDYRTETGAEDVSLNALATASLDVGIDHSLSVLSLFNKNVSDETSLRDGRSIDGPAQKWQLQYLARTLWFNQAFGDHRNLFGTRLRLRWSGFHAYGERDEPDRRTVAYVLTGGQYEWVDTTASGSRFYSKLRQDDLGATLSLRFPLWSQAWGTLGGFTQHSAREFGNRRFRMRKHKDNRDGTVFQRPVEELFSDAGIGQFTEMQDATRDNDSYESTQRQYSAYVMLETPLVGPLTLAGGARAEVVTQKVDSKSPFGTPPTSPLPGTDRTDVDYLPGVALKYELTQRMLLRAAYGMTVARPQIRELASYDYYDFVRERSVVGDPNLKRTLIHNGDLRWEWFFAEGEILAISGFYKRFIDPIELAVLDNVTGSSQFQNAKAARNVGGELELRLSLARFARALRWFHFDGNLALVQSRIDLPQNLTAVRSSRPLAGQSPYVANMSLRFNDPTTALTLSLVYNVVGPRISDVATLVGNVIPPDIEEAAFHSLDLVGSKQFGNHVKLKLRIRNMLLQRKELRQGNFLLQTTEPNLSASLGLSIGF